MYELNESNLDFFEEMYSETYKLVFYIINRIINNPQISEDLTQDTFVSAYNNLESLNPKNKESFKAWVSVIASNKAKDYLKKIKPKLFADIGEDDFEFDPEDKRLELRPDYQANTEDLKLMVNSVMNELPEDQRLMVMMFYFQQLSIKEISQLVGLKENTIKSKLSYAKAKIKFTFEKSEYQEYRLRSISPLVLFKLGLSVVPEIDIKAKSLGAITGLGTAQISKKNRKDAIISKVGTGLMVSGLVLSALNGMDTDIKKNSNNVEIEKTEVNSLIDVFDYVDVQFEGVNGHGKIVVRKIYTNDSNINEVLDSIYFETNSNTISNNSLIKVYISNFSEFDKVILDNEKYYLVHGLTN